MSTHDWSTQQQDIFNWFSSGEKRSLVVRARAGTGKTTTIIEGVKRAPEHQILMAAFSKPIAVELQKRLPPRAEAKTLHALGFKYIGRYSGWGKLDVDGDKRGKSLTVMADPGIPDGLIKLITNLHTAAREIEPFVVLKGKPSDLIDLAVRFEHVPDDEWEGKGWDLNRCCEVAFKAMQLAMEKTNIIDFADMIFLPLVMKWVRPWFDMVVVDEAQDMTIAQLALATGACRRSGRICIVGDNRQAIYAFRGADSNSLDRLKRQLDAVELGLTVTYRCAQVIVDLAKTFVPDYEAAPGAVQGTLDKCDQDQMIASAKPGDFILSRTNAPLVRVCMAILKRGVRARVKGRDIGKGVIILINKMRANNITELLAKLGDWHANECAKAMEKLPEAAAEERVNFVTDQKMIIEALADGATNILSVIQRCTDLFSDDTAAAVVCSTVHKAKGLEAERAFMLEGTFRKGGEEDNICYVAITRAKNHLTKVSGFERPKTPLEAVA